MAVVCASRVKVGRAFQDKDEQCARQRRRPRPVRSAPGRGELVQAEETRRQQAATTANRLFDNNRATVVANGVRSLLPRHQRETAGSSSLAPWQKGSDCTWNAQVDAKRVRRSILCVCAPTQMPRRSANASTRTASSNRLPRGPGRATPVPHQMARSPCWSLRGRRRCHQRQARHPDSQGQIQHRQCLYCHY